MEEQVQQKGWFGRNWMWVVPVGGCLTIILLFIFGIGAAIFGVSEVMKGSAPYELAVGEAMHNEELIAILGEPIETNGIMQGNLNFKNGSGSADISIPLKGPNGEATVFIKGEKEDGQWTYDEFYILLESNNERINLLDKSMEGN